MTRTIRTSVTDRRDLRYFWAQYFGETPLCAHPQCGAVACEVDVYFPYIDDFNRCDSHLPEFMDFGPWTARACGKLAKNLPARTSVRHSRPSNWRAPR